MSDQRELILARLLAIYKTVDGVKRVSRNEQVAEDWEFPAILLLDADEDSDDTVSNRNRPVNRTSLIVMSPETYVIFGGLPEDVGSELNRFRARVVKAVLTDAELATLVGTNGDVVYLGCATSLTRGRELIGDIGLNFSIKYLLKPDTL